MQLSIGEKIKVVMGRQKITITDLAEKLGQTRQNLSNKMNRDNFTEKEAKEIASALGCAFEGVFTFPDGTKL